MFMIHIKRIAYWLAFHSLNRAAHVGGGDATFGVRILLGNRLEDLTDIIIVTRRLKDIRAGRSQTVSLAELAAKYGLAESDRSRSIASALTSHPEPLRMRGLDTTRTND